MEVQDHEFKLMLKYLFFYHCLYSAFGENCAHDGPISIDQFTEALEDLVDDSVSRERSEANFSKLGDSPTFGDYVRQMTQIYLSEDTTSSHVSSLMLEEKLRGAAGAGRRSFTKESSGDHYSRARTTSLSTERHDSTLAHETISCVQYTCKDVRSWIDQIQELGVVPFKALIDDINVTRVVIAQQQADSSKCVMLIWHLDNGQGYRDFEEANTEEGGVFAQAAEEGAISLPFERLFFSLASHDGWNARIRPGDVLNLAHFHTKSHIGFTDSLQEDIDTLGRTSGAMQHFVGKQIHSTDSGGAILSHFTSQSWQDIGRVGADTFQADPPVKYMISGPVANISCNILATYETFTWLVDA